MNEGWYNNEYLVLFDESEVASATERYGISKCLPGYQVLGLRGWDDFILRDPSGHTYLTPTVPALPKNLSQFHLPEGSPALAYDERFCGKIKWYVKPIAFGGDPKTGENTTWVDHEEHAKLVQWWNETYCAVKAQTTPERAS
jgi:hypothetical protein